MTYKVGDNVIIRSDLEEGENSNFFTFDFDNIVSSMLKYKGKSAIITHIIINDGIEIRYHINLDNSSFYWKDSNFEEGIIYNRLSDENETKS